MNDDGRKESTSAVVDVVGLLVLAVFICDSCIILEEVDVVGSTTKGSEINLYFNVAGCSENDLVMVIVGFWPGYATVLA